MASVVVPAHQEERVIGRCLDALLGDADSDALEVIVVANGCTDNTAAIVKRYGRRVQLRELAVGSKTAALNAGDELASGFPRIYLDADVELPSQAVRVLVASLDSATALLAAPRRVLQLDAATWPVRCFFRSWQVLQAARGESIGSGVYALNEAGRARFERFPDVIGDDRFVYGLFGADERRVADAEVKVWPPSNMRELVNVRTRVTVGNMVHGANGSARTQRPSTSAQVGHVVREPAAVATLPFYLGVTLLIRLLARRRLKAGDYSWARAGRRV